MFCCWTHDCNSLGNSFVNQPEKAQVPTMTQKFRGYATDRWRGFSKPWPGDGALAYLVVFPEQGDPNVDPKIFTYYYAAPQKSTSNCGKAPPVANAKADPVSHSTRQNDVPALPMWARLEINAVLRISPLKYPKFQVKNWSAKENRCGKAIRERGLNFQLVLTCPYACGDCLFA